MMNQIIPPSTMKKAIPVIIRIARNIPSICGANVDACTGSHLRMDGLLVGGEGEVSGLGLAARDRDSGGLRAVPLMPGFDRVGAGGQSGDLVAAVRAAHPEERVRQHTEPRFHPAVHVTL